MSEVGQAPSRDAVPSLTPSHPGRKTVPRRGALRCHVNVPNACRLATARTRIIERRERRRLKFARLLADTRTAMATCRPRSALLAGVLAALVLATPAAAIGRPGVAALQVALRRHGLYGATVDGM